LSHACCTSFRIAGKLSNLKQRQQQQQLGHSDQQQQQEQQPCLWGVVRYGDNVEDEWFVVWLLLQLTQQLEGLCARAWDDDGEFILIEVRAVETDTQQRQGQQQPPPQQQQHALTVRSAGQQQCCICRAGSSVLLVCWLHSSAASLCRHLLRQFMLVVSISTESSTLSC